MEELPDYSYEQLMETIRHTATQIFKLASTENEVCQLEDAINQEVMYLAALAQSELVKPPEGWDPLGRC